MTLSCISKGIKPFSPKRKALTQMLRFRTQWAVVLAQLVEQLLPIPEVHGSNQVIGKKLFILIEHLFTVNCVLERRK